MESVDFSEIYLEYFDRVFAFLYKLCRNADLAEELTQETFFQALRSFHRYNGSCTLFTWLAAIGKNCYFKHLRKARSVILPDEPSLLLDLAAEPDDSGSPEDALLRREREQKVRQALKLLPDRSRDVVLLRIYGDLPFKEIAGLLEISESSAKVIFFRAKATLRELLEEGEESF